MSETIVIGYLDLAVRRGMIPVINSMMVVGVVLLALRRLFTLRHQLSLDCVREQRS